jgi:hypothetical protein
LTADELNRRLDGRTQRHLADTLGTHPSLVTHWVKGTRPVPPEYHEQIRRRYPLPAEGSVDLRKTLFATGYMQAIRDVLLNVGRLRDDFRARESDDTGVRARRSGRRFARVTDPRP